MRRLLLTLALVLGLAPQAQAAWHFELGIGEQQPRMFDDPRFAALGLDRVRIVTAYDVVCHPGVEQLYLDNWLAAAQARRRPPAGCLLVQPATRPALEAAQLPHLPALLPRSSERAIRRSTSSTPGTRPTTRRSRPSATRGRRPASTTRCGGPAGAARSPRATCSTGATWTAGCGATAPRSEAARGCGRCTTTWTSTARGRGGGRSRAGSCASPAAGSGSPRRPASCGRAATRATTRSARPTRLAACSPSRAAPRASSALYAYQWQASCNTRVWDSGWFRSDGEARPAYRVIVRALAHERKLDAAEIAALDPPLTPATRTWCANTARAAVR